MFFIRLFLANTWEKNRGSPCLLAHKLLWKVDIVLRSQSGWILCAEGTGVRYKITPIVFEITRDQACFLLFLCVWYRQHGTFKLEKSTLNAKEWGKSRFDEILVLWIFIFDYFAAPVFCLIPVRWFDFFAFAQLCLTKNFEENTIDCYSSYVRLFGFDTQQYVNSAANFVLTSKTGLPRVVLVLRWVLLVPEIFVSPL